VEFAIGPATVVVGADGRTRPAARGTEVDAGDTVRTQQNGRVQVRMADGAYISLQPNTEFGIKDYRFAGRTDGSENAFYSLLKGAMRTVTGLIGRVNRNKYLVSTPTATVGIRGTGGVIQVQDDGSTLVQGTSGVWFLANPSGTIDIPAGVSGVAPSDPNQPPQETTDVPTSGPGAAAPAAGVRSRRGARPNWREHHHTTLAHGNADQRQRVLGCAHVRLRSRRLRRGLSRGRSLSQPGNSQLQQHWTDDELSIFFSGHIHISTASRRNTCGFRHRRNTRVGSVDRPNCSTGFF
jgi:hypothetical protein